MGPRSYKTDTEAPAPPPAGAAREEARALMEILLANPERETVASIRRLILPDVGQLKNLPADAVRFRLEVMQHFDNLVEKEKRGEFLQIVRGAPTVRKRD